MCPILTTQKMLLCDVGVSDRDRSGWKFESPPLLAHPGVAASMLEGESSRISSGSGGAPGSPGFGRLGEAPPMLVPPTSDGGLLHFCNDGMLSEPATSEVDGLRSPSGWKSSVELLENVLARSLGLLGELKALSDEEQETPEAEGQRNEKKIKND